MVLENYTSTCNISCIIHKTSQNEKKKDPNVRSDTIKPLEQNREENSPVIGLGDDFYAFHIKKLGHKSKNKSMVLHHTKIMHSE
jgi:hypothetical protein